MHIIDRRLNPGSKSLENRQRFLRRAKALVQGAVKKSSQDRDIKEVLEGGEVSIPLDGMNEPRFRREGGTRDMVLPGNKKFGRSGKRRASPGRLCDFRLACEYFGEPHGAARAGAAGRVATAAAGDDRRT